MSVAEFHENEPGIGLKEYNNTDKNESRKQLLCLEKKYHLMMGL